MPSDIRQIALVVFAMLAAACSSTPATNGATAPQQSAPQMLAAAGNTPAIAPGTTSAGAAPPASAARPASAASPASATTPASAVDAGLVKAGYSVMKRHGEVLYCRNEVITGQRIGTRICLTAGQIQTEKQNVTKARDLLNQPANRCLGASCNN
jgi:hypothetical protein